MTEAKHYLQLHFVVFVWGFTAVLGILISLPSVEIVFYRTLLAWLGMGVMLYLANISFGMNRRVLFKVIGTGVLIGVHWILFFAAARVANASICLAGMATCSLWTSFLEPLFFKRKIIWYEIVLGALGALGLYVVFQFEFNHALGLAFAIGAAILASLFTIFNGMFIRDYHPFTITYHEMFGAWMSTVLFLPFYSGWISPNGVLQLLPTQLDTLYLFILAIICTVFAYSLAVRLMKHISPFAMNLTNNLEPVYGIILALIILGEEEHMSGGFYAGTFMILAAVLGYPFLNKYFKRRPLEQEVLR